MKTLALIAGLAATPVLADQSTVDDLYKKALELNGTEITVEGDLYHNKILEDEFALVVESGIKYAVTLDDGRGVTKRAQQCPDSIWQTDKPGCAVKMNLELELISEYFAGESIQFRGVGYNVEFK